MNTFVHAGLYVVLYMIKSWQFLDLIIYRIIYIIAQNYFLSETLSVDNIHTD